MNLPDNHKRVSLAPPVEDASSPTAVSDRRTSQDETRIQAISDKESNFNLDDFNIASVSMPVFNLFYFIAIYFMQKKIIIFHSSFFPCV